MSDEELQQTPQDDQAAASEETAAPAEDQTAEPATEEQPAA